MKAAMHMLLTGEAMTAAEVPAPARQLRFAATTRAAATEYSSCALAWQAQKLGMINRVFPADGLRAEGQALAETIARVRAARAHLCWTGSRRKGGEDDAHAACVLGGEPGCVRVAESWWRGLGRWAGSRGRPGRRVP